MSSNKRRKLDISSQPILSAVAATKALKERTQQILSTQENPGEHGGATTLVTPTPKLNTTSESHNVKDSRILEQESKAISKRAIIFEADDDEEPSGSLDSREESPEPPISRPSMVFSTIKPNNRTFKQLRNGSVSLCIGPGERLVILGQYGLSVHCGQVTFLGSTLRPSRIVHRIYAPSSHALPVIRCPAGDIKQAEIQLHQCKGGLETLNSLSPLFGKLWNDGSGTLNEKYESLLPKRSGSSFQILFSSVEGPSKSFLQPLISPPEWNEAIAKLSGDDRSETPSFLICGPKSSGKSTFAKMLGNRILSTATSIKTDPKFATGVAILDLDPGQPEYTPPGFLSLIHIKKYNFGPPFSHPASTPECQIIRSHSIAAISPSLDPTLYMASTLDLFSHYRILLSKHPDLPLIVNTPGWVLGTGLEILVDLITQVHPTKIIYMSQDGPPEVVRSLRDAGKRTPLYTLPSQGSEYATRTAAHLRTMQFMSYFHLDNSNVKQGLTWKDTPLTSIPPWQVKYSGPGAGILGILCYGEQPPANLLADTINGSLVSIVVIDAFLAIPGWQTNQQSDNEASDQQENGDSELRVFDDEILHPHDITKPLIVRTPDEDLPYFSPANCISLDPKHSHTIGLALIRGVDISKKRLQMLTPISPIIFREINEDSKSVVLVSGKLDTPGWAYTEELIQKEFLEKAEKASKMELAEYEGSDEDIEEREEIDEVDYDVEIFIEKTSRVPGDGFHSAPWVETLHGSQGRGIGSRVWRVRRDLGRDTSNGD